MEKLTTQNLVIGFGKAGKTLAATLAKHGEQVILAEKDNTMYGGTCINIGCIPSKKLLVEGERRPCGIADEVAFEQAMATKKKLVEALRNANFNKLDGLDNVRIINAEAAFAGPHSVHLTSSAAEYEVEAERIFINTGTLPVRINVPGADGKRIYDSTGFLSLPFLPKRVVIVGGGYISLEFASMYRAFGSEITILEAGDTFLAREDRDIAEEMMRVMTSKGIKIVLNAKTERFVENEEDTLVVTSEGDFKADAVLVGIGRRPNTAGLNLEKAGVKTDARGFIVTDDHLLAATQIWAMGDVAGSPQFTYISLDDFRIVSSQLFGDGHRQRQDRQVIPTAVFTYPPLAHIGMTETQALKAQKDVIVKKLMPTAVPKAKVLGQTDGLMKAVIDAKTDRILGVTLFCAESHELINLIKMAMDNDIPASYIQSQIFTHPTIAEALNDLFA
ncbi:MAG: FAD-dependent oxidoreductase [Prevotella sp.]|jgi:pyruvate/2-oxoglutarate dehydrogenase complex dihydrolipoamide dehydrogenase (E3) component|nr:FAD-dependent oxidoreductase [Prevotella sp.]MCI1282127.1 FAD-dependent oxidoreductase [Prevotella sp.]